MLSPPSPTAPQYTTSGQDDASDTNGQVAREALHLKATPGLAGRNAKDAEVDAEEDAESAEEHEPQMVT